jgi:hypothetical protein
MKKIIFLCLSLLLLFACGYKEGVIQKSEKSYLKFVGNWQNAQIQIDDLKQFKLDDYSGKDNESGTKKEPPEPKLYQLSPGKHDIKIFKGGVMVVDRKLLLENQAIMEVFIP